MNTEYHTVMTWLTFKCINQKPTIIFPLFCAFSLMSYRFLQFKVSMCWISLTFFFCKRQSQAEGLKGKKAAVHTRKQKCSHLPRSVNTSSPPG